MDGYVDIFDINLISDNWDSVGLLGSVAGDATKDGVVDIFDVNLVSVNWNDSPLVVPVPEPASIVLLLGTAGSAAVGLWSPRRRRLQR